MFVNKIIITSTQDNFFAVVEYLQFEESFSYNQQQQAVFPKVFEFGPILQIFYITNLWEFLHQNDSFRAKIWLNYRN